MNSSLASKQTHNYASTVLPSLAFQINFNIKFFNAAAVSVKRSDYYFEHAGENGSEYLALECFEWSEWSLPHFQQQMEPADTTDTAVSGELPWEQEWVGMVEPGSA